MEKYTALYVRVSTVDKQLKGVRSQEDALIDYCKNHNITKTIIYKDMVTGGTLERPALKQLKQDIFIGKIGTVIVWKLDRLSRSLKDGINLLVSWLEKDIRVVSISQQFDFSGSVGQLVASVLLGIGQMERENICENIRRGIAVARKNGKRIGGSKPKIFADDILKLKKQGYRMTEIAEELNCSRQALYLALHRSS